MRISAPSARMLLETNIEDPRWNALNLASLAEKAAYAALEHLHLKPENCEISLLGCGDHRISQLNQSFRDKPGPTNVLSWPDEDLSSETAGGVPIAPEPDPTGNLTLGDIAIAYETCRREATDQGKPVEDHVSHLIVHAVLHLLGYDHIRDQDATLMEGLEVDILGKMGLPDPYRTDSGV